MQVETGGETGTSYIANGLTGTDRLSHRNRYRCHVTVQCRICTVVLDNDIVAVSAAAAAAAALRIVMRASGYDTNDCAALRCHDCRTGIAAGNINSAMCCTPAVAEGTGNGIESRTRPGESAAGRCNCAAAAG